MELAKVKTKENIRKIKLQYLRIVKLHNAKMIQQQNFDQRIKFISERNEALKTKKIEEMKTIVKQLAMERLTIDTRTKRRKERIEGRVMNR